MPDDLIMTESGLWAYVTERVAIRDRRASGQPPPWTADPLLAGYHFPNVHRTDDLGTRWFHDRRLANDWDREETLWASIAYRPLNRVETFDRLGGPPPRDPDAINDWLDALRAAAAGGETICTSRHFSRGVEAYGLTLKDAADSWGELAGLVLDAPDLPTLTRRLTTVNGLGPFFAWQVTCDLLESRVIPHSEDDWALFGPGAVSALDLILSGCPVTDYVWGRAPKRTRVEELRPFADDLNRRQGERLPPWLEPRLTLKDLEHALCEYLRYARLQAGFSSRGGKRSWTTQKEL